MEGVNDETTNDAFREQHKLQDFIRASGNRRSEFVCQLGRELQGESNSVGLIL